MKQQTLEYFNGYIWADILSVSDDFDSIIGNHAMSEEEMRCALMFAIKKELDEEVVRASKEIRESSCKP